MKLPQSDYYLRVLTFASIYAIFAVSWDLLSGYTGQANFGHALFFGVAAYGSALLHKYLGWQPVVTIPLGALAGTLAGVVTCIPALRLRGPYLSLLTLAFPIMLLGLVFAFKDVTGGEYGIMGLPRLGATVTDEYYICLLVMTVSVLIMWKLSDAGSRYIRTGLIFHAIREDEIAARATGINTIRYKILAFAVGGLFAGIAGALFTHVIRVAGPSTLAMTMSFQAIIWVVFGGIVSIYGAVVGVYTLYPLVEFLRRTPVGEYRLLILPVVVILILLFMPEGLAVWIRDKIETECPRCKLTNGSWRRECRACSAPLH
ncbi:MAG: branched-chain amino acid ABC transporter permease [Chloroflexota bacterium]|nr:MAG: branched-chain amino acid ABC transporter permease [Chloroflexota bacterium]